MQKTAAAKYRHFAAVFLLLASCASSCPAKEAGSNKVSKAEQKLQEEVDTLLDAQCDAWNRGNLNDFMSAYLNSPETSFSSGGKMTWGFESLKERYNKKYGESEESMGTVHFSELKIRSLSRAHDAALALGRWHLDRKQGSVGGLFSLALEKRSGKWKIVHDHTSIDPDAHD